MELAVAKSCVDSEPAHLPDTLPTPVPAPASRALQQIEKGGQADKGGGKGAWNGLALRGPGYEVKTWL